MSHDQDPGDEHVRDVTPAADSRIDLAVARMMVLRYHREDSGPPAYITIRRNSK